MPLRRFSSSLLCTFLGEWRGEKKWTIEGKFLLKIFFWPTIKFYFPKPPIIEIKKKKKSQNAWLNIAIRFYLNYLQIFFFFIIIFSLTNGLLRAHFRQHPIAIESKKKMREVREKKEVEAIGWKLLNEMMLEGKIELKRMSMALI